MYEINKIKYYFQVFVVCFNVIGITNPLYYGYAEGGVLIFYEHYIIMLLGSCILDSVVEL